MTDSDRPLDGSAGEPVTFDDGVEDISNLLGPTPDPDEDEVDEQESDEAEDDAPEGVEDDAEDDSEGEEADDEADDEDSEDEDGPEASEDGFAPETAKIKLRDGSTTTVGEIQNYVEKRVADFQRSYTQKTTEISEFKQRVDTAAQKVAEERDLVLELYQDFIPAAPSMDLLQSDPMAYMEQKATYEDRQKKLSEARAKRDAFMAEQRQQQEAQHRELVEQNRQWLAQADPEFRDPKSFAAFRDEAVKAATEYYHIRPDELDGVFDARQILVLKDAIAYRKLKNKAPATAKAAVEGKPKVLKGGKRMNPKNKQQKQAADRAARLRSTGDFDAGVAALMDLDI